MIKLCKNLFYKPKYGSDADSLMLKHLFSTVTTILVCLAAISFSAYAFFASTVTSGSNTIKASRFSASVTIKRSDESQVAQGKIETYTFDPGVYAVTINTDDSTTGTGFYIISVNGATFYTQQLGVDLNAPGGERKEVSFQLDVKATAEVQFDARWGTNSHYDSVAESEFYIKNEQQKTIVVEATQGAADNTDETKPESTEPDSTTEATDENATESTTEATTESTTVETTTPTTEPTATIHIVQDGESLALIAQMYGVDRFVLADYNKLDNPSLIQIGQKINIPPADWEMPDDATTSQTTPETTAPTEQTEPATTLPEETQPTTQTTLPEETQPATQATDAPVQ